MRQALGGLILCFAVASCDEVSPRPGDGGPQASRDASEVEDAGGHDAAGPGEDASSGCGDTTSNPSHCGSCGHACAAGTGSCVAGTCVPAYSPCLTESSGVLTCRQACEQLGAVCSLEGCGTSLFGWQLAALSDCEASEFDTGRGRDWPCDEAIHWFGAETGAVRCCCAER